MANEVPADTIAAAEKVLAAAEKVSNEISDASSMVPKEAIDTFGNLSQTLFDQLAEMTAQYGPEMVDIVFTLIRLNGVWEVLTTIMVAGTWLALFGALTYTANKRLELVDLSDEGRGWLGFVSWASKLAAIVVPSFVFIGNTNLFVWLSIIEPKAALAYKLLGKFLGF